MKMGTNLNGLQHLNIEKGFVVDNIYGKQLAKTGYSSDPITRAQGILYVVPLNFTQFAL